MMAELIKIIFISDIIGAHGCDVVASVLPRLQQKYAADLVIANGENATQGKGLDDKTAKILFDLNIDVITSGNHIWQRLKYFKQLETHPHILRPLNYPSECPGQGVCIFETKTNKKIAVINLQGRSFMYPVDCPFKTLKNEINRLKKLDIQTIFVDFHAEATAEKIALGWYADGHVSAVIGTHTHVQTADERILPEGTAYLTDAGMTGPFQSVIGMNINASIERFITQMPVHYLPASPVDLKLCGVYIAINQENGKSETIERIQIDV